VPDLEMDKARKGVQDGCGEGRFTCDIRVDRGGPSFKQEGEADDCYNDETGHCQRCSG
jgi:hypothetical protein